MPNASVVSDNHECLTSIICMYTASGVHMSTDIRITQICLAYQMVGHQLRFFVFYLLNFDSLDDAWSRSAGTCRCYIIILITT